MMSKEFIQSEMESTMNTQVNFLATKLDEYSSEYGYSEIKELMLEFIKDIIEFYRLHRNESKMFEFLDFMNSMIYFPKKYKDLHNYSNSYVSLVLESYPKIDKITRKWSYYIIRVYMEHFKRLLEISESMEVFFINLDDLNTKNKATYKNINKPIDSIDSMDLIKMIEKAFGAHEKAIETNREKMIEAPDFMILEHLENENCDECLENDTCEVYLEARKRNLI